MILAVDAGNSRVKWALHDGRRFVRDGWVSSADVDGLDMSWRQLPEVSSVAVANVAGERVAAAIGSLSGRWNIAARFITGAKAECGVTNRYDDPAQLGPDRWAALIGARALFPADCLVINAGTAMTVDALSAQGEFIGGIIVPGFDLMHQALATHTARLSAQQGRFSPFPRNTPDAITSGAIQALCGAVLRMRLALLEDGRAEPTLVVAGGAARHLAPCLGYPVKLVQGLVLEGLVRIAVQWSAGP